MKITAATFALGTILFGQQPVQAQSEGGALVIHSCPETTSFTGTTYGYEYEVCADIVFTPSGNINATFHGSLVDPSNAPQKTLISRGFPCEYNNELTYDTQVIINPDGTVNGSCQVHGKH
jgi:hypothetical protein